MTIPALRDLLPDLGKRTLIMGILNVTPDSFSDGGRFFASDAAVAQALRLVADGADLIDIGGESTRPGAVRVTAQEEMDRVLPVLAEIRHQLPRTPLSLDTTRADVARAGVAAGASLINDISGGTMDTDMLSTVAALQVPLCLMHLPVRPDAMGWSKAGGGLAPDDDAVAAVVRTLRAQITAALAAGIPHHSLFIDPGFGFGKTPEQNLDLLRRTAEIRAALDDLPLLLGPSRKSTIARILGEAADAADPERQAGTAALVALSANFGVDIVRVHDVAFMARVAKVADAVCRIPIPPAPFPTGRSSLSGKGELLLDK